MRRIIWKNSELHIDLSDLLNDTRILIVTGFNHRDGITWTLLTDDKREYYDDPFTAPYLPTWEYPNQRDDQIQAFLDGIPPSLLNALRPYRRDRFGLLMLSSRHRLLAECCERHPMLFWLLYRQAQVEQWPVVTLLDICSLPITDRLRPCQLPDDTVTLEILNKLQAPQFAQHEYELIHRCFAELDVERLNRLPAIPDHLLRFLLRQPQYQALSLLSTLERYDYNALLRSIRSIEQSVHALQLNLSDVERQVATLANLSALNRYQERLHAAATTRLLDDYEKRLGEASDTSLAFPSPPFSATENLQPITRVVDLLAECRLLNHDAIRYVSGIQSGYHYAYRVLNPVYCTAIIILFKTRDDKLLPVIKEVLANNGNPVAEADLNRIKSHFKQI
ncbi:hypothetical protein IVG45_19145 [Methylomonas sp. LL1]|uniref:hypothetical protein n=1 Tax=Methylomonas sp. LL1 TaxID=2785785 RepID=UPI0018C3E89B|nr:hypothetical protein [Methylomonas sp. LL1]QPK62919.1 hypothetical protein IVG45_19145 [Methylomonas sp. LL1]